MVSHSLSFHSRLLFLLDPSLTSQTGGLSGAPLYHISLACVSNFYKLTDGKIPIIGCGGISNGKQAVEFAKAGARLVQVYTSFVYSGPSLVEDIKEEIMKELDGKKWDDVIGQNHK